MAVTMSDVARRAGTSAAVVSYVLSGGPPPGGGGGPRADGTNPAGPRWWWGSPGARRERTMAERLANEVMDASNGIGAAIKRRDDLQKMADSNKAFAHYRW